MSIWETSSRLAQLEKWSSNAQVGRVSDVYGSPKMCFFLFVPHLPGYVITIYIINLKKGALQVVRMLDVWLVVWNMTLIFPYIGNNDSN